MLYFKRGGYGMIGKGKTRVQMTLELETLEQARAIAKELGVTLSTYTNMVLKAVGARNMDKAFESVLIDFLQLKMKDGKK